MSDHKSGVPVPDKRSMSIVDESAVRRHPTRGHVRRAGGRRQAFLAVFALVVIGGVVAAAYFLFLPHDETYRLTNYDTATVTVTTLQDTVEVSGGVNARSWATVGAPEAGVIDRLYVEEGDWVTAGQVVASLDAESVQETLESRQKDLERQQRTIDRFVLNDQFTMRGYDRQRENAVEAVLEAQDELADVQDLYDMGAASRSELEDAQKKVADAQDALDDHDAEVEEYQAIHQLDAQNNEDDLQALQDEIAALEERIANTVVHAPISGRVISLSDAATTEGELLTQYEAIMQIADTRNPLVETDIEEQYVPFIEVGQPVAVEISGTRIQGSVERIGLTATTSTSGGTPTVELDIALDVGDSEILPGSSALVEVLIGEIPDAMVLPRGQYLTSGNRRYLYRVEGETATRIPFEYGTITDSYVQIVSGVAPGDVIITSSYQNFIDYPTIELGDTE